MIKSIEQNGGIGAGGSAVWGGIGGTLSDQTDLQGVLDQKQIFSNLVTEFQATPDDTHYSSEKLIKDSLDLKADSSALLIHTDDSTIHFTEDSLDKYTQTEVDNLLDDKADQSSLTSHTDDSTIHFTEDSIDKYTQTEVDNLLDDKADQSSLTSHVDDSTIHFTEESIDKYTQAEVDNLLSAKQSISNLVTGFQATPDDTHYASEKLVKDSLDGKASSSDLTSHTGDSTIHFTEDSLDKYTQTEVDNLIAPFSALDEGTIFSQMAYYTGAKWTYTSDLLWLNSSKVFVVSGQMQAQREGGASGSGVYLASLKDTTSGVGVQMGATTNGGWVRSVKVNDGTHLNYGVLNLGVDYVAIGDGDDNDQLYLDTVNKRLGIGRTNPQKSLDVLHASEAQLRLSNTSSEYAEFRVKPDGSLLISHTGTQVGVGQHALAGSMASGNTAIGALSANANQGDSCVSVGYRSLHSNAGNLSAGVGYEALENNSGSNAVGMGSYVGIDNTANNAIGFGSTAINKNTGNAAVGIGQYALRYNEGDDNIAIGRSAWSTFVENSSGEKTFDNTDVNTSTDQITVSSHGFGGFEEWVNVKYTEGTSAITGLTDGNVYQVKIIDGDTLDFYVGTKGVNITNAGSGTGHTLTPQTVYTNSVVIGAEVEPTASNQINLGDTLFIDTSSGQVDINALDVNAGLSLANSAVQPEDLETVATSGDHTDLSNIGTNTHAQIDSHIDSTADSSGWISAGETWTYSGVDDPTGVITISGDVTDKYSAGMKIKFNNGGSTIYGIISKDPSYSSPNTTITFLHEIDPTDSQAKTLIADSTITNPYYSMARAPFSFPLQKNKWTVKYKSETLQQTEAPTTNTWYNKGSLEIPIGVWTVSYESCFQIGVDSAAGMYGQTTLSTANNSESDDEFTSSIATAASQTSVRNMVGREKEIALTAKATYYRNYRSNSSADDLYFIDSAGGGGGAPGSIRAVSAYI